MVKSPKKVRILGSFKMYIEYRGICLLFSKKWQILPTIYHREAKKNELHQIMSHECCVFRIQKPTRKKKCVKTWLSKA
jgi:hypothetical protein